MKKIIELLKLRFLIGQMTNKEWYWADKNRPDNFNPEQLFELGEQINTSYKKLTEETGVCSELKKFGIFRFYKDSLPFYDVLFDLVFDGYPNNCKSYMQYGVGHWFSLWDSHKNWSRKKFGPCKEDTALRDIVDDLDMFIWRELCTCESFELDIDDFWEIKRYVSLVLLPIVYNDKEYQPKPNLVSTYCYRATDRLVKAFETFLAGTRWANENEYDSKIINSCMEAYKNKFDFKEVHHNYTRVLYWANIYRNVYSMYDVKVHNKFIV